MDKKLPLKPWQAVHANLTELIKYWKAAHESVLGFHWKKLPPFSLIFPQVDFLRIQRVMTDLRGHCQSQIEQLARFNKNMAPQTPNPKPFYATVIPYLVALDQCAEELSVIAAMKHAKLEGKSPKIRDLHQILRQYEEQVLKLKQCAGPAREAWITLEQHQQEVKN